jgi:O-methyltransferase
VVRFWAYLICLQNHLNEEFEKHHFVFDSFEGLSQPGTKDGDHWYAGALEVPEEIVRQNLNPFTKFTLYKGWIPERFDEVSDRKFSFVHIDVDLYQPTADSMAFFYQRMVNGGIILCDDYGFGTCPGATQAVNSFLTDKPEKILNLSAGGGFLIKGINTAENFRLPL